MTQSLRLLGILFVIALLIISGCSKKQEAEPEVETTAVEPAGEESYKDSLIIEMASKDSISVYDLLGKNHELETKNTATGIFIIAIDSVKNSEGMFWVYSVNDEMGQIASDNFMTKPGDIVRWHFRDFNK
jgi:PBP1b-binding outer membrane lipoprotein LpoB